MKAVSSRVINESTDAQLLELQKCLLGQFVQTKKAERCNERSIFIGKSLSRNFSEEEKLALSCTKMKFDPNSYIQCFNKLIAQNNVFTVSNYKGCRRRNCYVKTVNNDICKIMFLCVLPSCTSHTTKHCNPVIFCQKLLHTEKSSLKGKAHLIQGAHSLIVIKPSHIISKCIVLNNSPLWLSALLNLFDRD